MRRIVVTGANKGIGLAIARAILSEQPDTFVYLGSRDEARGRAAIASLTSKDASWAPRLEALVVDVASKDSIETAAARVETLHGLVNNAGINRDGRAAVLQTNTIGLRDACAAFLPRLEPNGGRIVNVTSASGPLYVGALPPEQQRAFCDPDASWASFDELLRTAPAASDNDVYGLSKALANLATMILAREHPHLVVNACTPGFIETDMTSHFLGAGQTAAASGMKPPSAGARAPMHLLFGAVHGSGHFYGSDAKRSPLDRYRAPGSAEHTD